VRLPPSVEAGVSEQTQAQRILNLLVGAAGEWVPAPQLAEISLQYSARISELRALGHPIENRVTMSRHGGRHGFFRLATPQMQKALAAIRPPQPEPESDLNLFDIGEKRSVHRDDG
jgi:hypothetical protein